MVDYNQQQPFDVYIKDTKIGTITYDEASKKHSLYVLSTLVCESNELDECMYLLVKSIEFKSFINKEKND